MINLLFCPLEFRFRGGGEDQVQDESRSQGRIQFEATLMDGNQALSSQKSAEVQLQGDGQPIHFDTDMAWTLTRTRGALNASIFCFECPRGGNLPNHPNLAF